MSVHPVTGSRIRLPRALRHQVVLGAGDQAIVSATTFISSVLIGRVAGADELGVYAMGMSLLFFAMSVQDAVISTSYIIHSRHFDRDERRQYAGSTLLQSVVFAAAVALLAAWLLAAADGSSPEGRLFTYGPLFLLLMPLALLRQFGRKISYAQGYAARAVLVDGAVATIQISGLVLLATTGSLPAQSAFGVVILASFVGASVWWGLSHETVEFARSRWRRDLRLTMSQGKWVLACRLVSQTHRYSALWLLGLLGDPQSAGVFAACTTIVSASNIVLIGFSNVIEPQVADALSETGRRGVQQMERRITLLFGLFMGFFSIAMYAAGGPLISLLYAGPEYDGHTHTVGVLALALLVDSLSVGAGLSLRILHRAELNLRANIVAAVLSISLAALLVPRYGTLGASYAVLGGNVVATVMRCWIYQRVLKEDA